MYRYCLYGHQFNSPVDLLLPQSQEAGLGSFTIAHEATEPNFSETAVVRCQPKSGLTKINWKLFEFSCHTNGIIGISPSVAQSREGIQLLTKSILPIALMTHRHIVLHASAFASNGTGYLILGKSGTGKSTLAQYAASQNNAHVGDDSVLLVEKAGDFYIAPSGTGTYLADDSFRYLALTEDTNHIFSPKGKRFIAPENIKNQETSLLRLEKIIHLIHENETSKSTTAIARLKVLMDSVYMSDVMLSFGAAHYLTTLKRLVEALPIESLLAERPQTEQSSLKFQPTRELYERIVS